MAVTCSCDSCVLGEETFCHQRKEQQTEKLNLAQVWMNRMGDQTGFVDACLQSAFKSLRLLGHIGDGAHGLVYRGYIDFPQPTPAHAQATLSNIRGGNIGVKRRVAVKHIVCGVSEAVEHAQEAIFASCLAHPNIALSLGCILMSGNESAERSIEPYLSSPGYWLTPSEMDVVPECCQSFDILPGDTEDDACVDVFHIQELGSMGNLRKAIGTGDLAGCEEALLTARDIAKGINYLHSSGFIHGDISSSNVVRYAKESTLADPRDFNAKIIDFGKSKSRICEFKVSESSSPMGTMCYMSPEHVLDGHVTTASDVHSFGTVLWELCTGEFAWDGYLTAQIVHALTEKMGLGFPPHSNTFSHWPKSLWDSVAALGSQCLALEPSNRPSMQQVVDTLNDILLNVSFA
eukprot:jgi/Picsp_1/2998/NSC_01221-R1_kinase-like protein